MSNSAVSVPDRPHLCCRVVCSLISFEVKFPRFVHSVNPALPNVDVRAASHGSISSKRTPPHNGSIPESRVS